ncbi:DUF1835 domain-containing protein [Agriterribacter sp.]|uniref:DUF1835 domain-containing protein n=1 Tax=Agriterribacter sp. TaxID=2821509 RepID=UPI002BDDB9EA|nr:DUF1835 domain-containing protein [Agriterribacter sp.]HRO46906.1 DUF1835 domain-containing protein [Agriterribacter sp.]HRQ17400.1 DUF1835 domain-containing protein [Agriterribacter sp.]
MIHIVFNEADTAVLTKAIELDETLQGEVVQIKDDYAVGPLANIYIGEGIAARKTWWMQVLAGGDYDGKTEDGSVDDYKTIAELVGELRRNPGEIVWIWAAQNKHDVSGYYWLLHFLKEFQGRVFILYLNNLPFFNEKGNIFYPSWLHTIPPKEFLKAKKLARPITLSEFEVDPDEWIRLCNENKGVRILEGGKKLVQYDYDFYDADLKSFITKDWQKAGKLIAQFLSKNKHTTGDAYLLWRLKLIIAGGEYEIQGALKNMKDFEIRRKAGITEQVNE